MKPAPPVIATISDMFCFRPLERWAADKSESVGVNEFRRLDLIFNIYCIYCICTLGAGTLEASFTTGGGRSYRSCRSSGVQELQNENRNRDPIFRLGKPLRRENGTRKGSEG